MSASAALPPLRAPSWIERIALPGGGEASVTVPLGATTRRPILVALHGAGDRPEWACGGWRVAAGEWPFVVCPFGVASQKGIPEPSRVYMTAPLPQVRRDIEEALAIVRSKYSDHVDDRAVVLAGFSMGAYRAASLATDTPGRYPAVALLEGAYEMINLPWATSAARAGTQRVLLGCGQGGCAATMTSRRAVIERAGVGVRLLDARTGRHNLDGEMIAALREPMRWLTEGLPGWAITAP